MNAPEHETMEELAEIALDKKLKLYMYLQEKPRPAGI